MPSKDPVIIIGGGISGLATAYYLARQGFRSTLLEKDGRLGGLIRTDSVEGCELEAGPDSYIASKPAVTELARELGIEDQIIGSNDERCRVFLVRHGELRPLPKGMILFAPAQWGPTLQSDLFSYGTKLRFLRETLFRPRTRADDVSLKQFVSEHFGSEVLDILAEPLLSGVYGGDVGSLSAQSVLPRFLDYEQRYGSVIRGVRQEQKTKRPGSLFLSFRAGMQTLIDALRRAVEGHCEFVWKKANTVVRDATNWVVTAGEASFRAPHVVLACSAFESAALVRALSPKLASELDAIPYSTAILVTLLYRRSEMNHPLNAFGFLVPRSERKTLAAATWISTKFPSRTPGDWAALRGFILGEQAESLIHAPDTELAGTVQSEFERLMHLQAKPVSYRVNRWPRSMPQYVAGHEARCERIFAIVNGLTAFHLTGNAYRGVGIPDCVRNAKEIAAQIMDAQKCETMAKT